MATSGTKDVTATWTTSGNVGDTLRFYWYQTGQSVSGNYTDIAWQLQLIAGGAGAIYSSASKSWSVTVNGTGYSGTNTVGISNNQTKTLASGTTRIYHNSDGTKSFGVSFSQVFNVTFNSWVGTVSGSASWTLNTIPRATTPSLSPSSVVMGNTISISLPRASSSFTHTLQHDFCMGSWTQFASGAGTSASLIVPVDWAERVPNAASATGRIRCLTYNGGTLIGEKIVNFTATVPTDIVPSVTGITVEEAVEEIAEQFEAYIQSHSKLKVTVSGEGAYGSTISAYQVNIGSYSYSGQVVTTDEIQESGVVTLTAIVTDSRGRTASMETTVNVVPYTSPTVRGFSAYRATDAGAASNEGTALKCEYNISIANCNDKNTKSFKIEYRQADEESASWATAATGSVYTANTSVVKAGVLSQEYSYEVRITLSDFFNESVQYTVRVGATVFPLAFLPNLKGVGIGGCPDDEMFQVFMDSEFRGSLQLTDVDGEGTNLDVAQELLEINDNLTLPHIVESGVVTTDNNTQRWYYQKYSDGCIKLYLRHQGWSCHAADTNTLFKLPFALPDTNYLVLLSKEQYGSSAANFTNAYFIANGKTTTQFNVYCYRSGSNSLMITLTIEVVYMPS